MLDEGVVYLIFFCIVCFVFICDVDVNVDEVVKKFESDFKGVAWSFEVAFAGISVFFDVCVVIDESDVIELKYNGLFEVVCGGGMFVFCD